MEWTSVHERLPHITNLVLVKDGDESNDDDCDIFVAYLNENGKWIINCPCLEICYADHVFEWKDID